MAAFVASWLTEGLRRAAQRKRNYHKIAPTQAGVINSYAPGFHTLLTSKREVLVGVKNGNTENGGGGGIRTRGRG